MIEIIRVAHHVVRIARWHRIDSHNDRIDAGWFRPHDSTVHNNNSAIRGNSLYGTPMNRQRRIPPWILGVTGVAAFTVSLACPAQAVDNRPTYYLMLKSLEDGFKAYNDDLASALEARIARIRADFAPERREIAQQIEQLEAERTRRTSEFNTRRDALNERIDAINTQIALRDGRAKEERRIEKRHSARHADDPEIKALMERVAAELAEIDTVRRTYLTQLATTRKARADLTRQFEEYMSAGDPLALEIRSLEQHLQRFAEGERRKLKKLADAYAVDYAAYNEWLESARVALDAAGAAVAQAVETDREQRAMHAQAEAELRELIGEYNALVEVHNKAPADDPSRDERALKFSALEERIAELQSKLAQARQLVVEANEAFVTSKHEYDERYSRFAREKREKEAALAGALAEINAERVAVEADIDARRQKVDAQIKALEAQISNELGEARGNLETLSRRLVEDFGRDHEGLDVAIKRVIEENDEDLLYSAAGAPRFDLSRPKTASVYRAVERVLADRRRIDARIVALEERARGTRQPTNGKKPEPAAPERERAALSTERQQLLEAHATFAREQQAKAAALDRRRRELDARVSEEIALSKELFSARAELTRLEFEAVQQVLVAAIRGLPGPTFEPGDHARLLSALDEKAGRVRGPVDPSLRAPHALLDSIAIELPAGNDTHGGWQPFSARKITDSTTLTGKEKAAVASAWLARFRRQRQFQEVAAELDASGAVMDGTETLSNLFLAGVLQHAHVVEQRLVGGGVGIQVGVLGRAYQLDANGALERLPGA